MTAGDSDPKDLDIAEVEEKIDEARRRAEEDGVLPPSEPQRTWRDPDGDGEDELPGPGGHPGIG